MIPPHRDHAEDQQRKGGNAEQFPHGTKSTDGSGTGRAPIRMLRLMVQPTAAIGHRSQIAAPRRG